MEEADLRQLLVLSVSTCLSKCETSTSTNPSSKLRRCLSAPPLSNATATIPQPKSKTNPEAMGHIFPHFLLFYSSCFLPRSTLPGNPHADHFASANDDPIQIAKHIDPSPYPPHLRYRWPGNLRQNSVVR